jgi:hypothetical protein
MHEKGDGTHGYWKAIVTLVDKIGRIFPQAREVR